MVIREGDVEDGIVTGVHPWGVEVSIGEIRAFVQPIEISWDGAQVKEGSPVRVLVYAVTGDGVFASIKRAQSPVDPWLEEARDIGVGGAYQGLVVRNLGWGLRVNLRGKVDGVVVTGQTLDWREGEKVNVVVKAVNLEMRKIDLELAGTQVR